MSATGAIPIITLTSDFGLDDWYVATMKAVLLTQCREARLVDITHRIPPGDVLRGSIALERAIAGFPSGTVHLAVIDPGVGTSRRILLARLSQQWVVCPDNGLITWAWQGKSERAAWQATWRPPKSSDTFHGRDIMAPLAGMLARGVDVTTLASPISDPILLDVRPADVNAPEGVVIHIDRFGNAMTNITAGNAALGRGKVLLNGAVLPLGRTYSDVAPGQPLALIGSSGLLEIAVRDGSAQSALRISVGDAVCLAPPSPAAPYNPGDGAVRVSSSSLRSLDKQLIWHPFTPMSLWLDSDPLVISAAEGMYLIDSDGRRYLDGVSSLWCNVHGHRVPEIDSAIRQQLDRVAHTTMLGLASEPAILLAERLMRVVPPNLKKVFYSDSGATATEIAFKLAVQYWHNVGQPGKTEFLALTEAYHGDTVGAMSVGRTTLFHKPYFPLLFKVHYAPTPYVYRSSTPDDPAAVKRASLLDIEQILREHHRTIAAVALEPVVQGAAGMIVQPPGFLAEVRRLANEYGVLLIADEVATGFGRTGRFFACEHERVQPDLLCAAKGISGGYLPLAATFATQTIFDAFLGQPWEGKTFYHGHTYTGNPLACAAAIASFDLIQRRNLIARVAEKAERLAQMLSPLLDLPHVGEIRQKGFMVGVELVADRATRRAFDPRRRLGAEVCMNMRNHGVIVRPLGDVIVLMPPLAMEEADLRTIVDALAAEVGAIHDQAG